MAMVEFDAKTMATGVQSIDEQHRELIRMLNELMEATGRGEGREAIGAMMTFLGDYAKTHFAHEEGVMASHACPVAEVNQRAHAKFLEDFTSLSQRFEDEGPSLTFVMLVQRKVIDWLTAHIRGCDTQLRKCVAPSSP